MLAQSRWVTIPKSDRCGGPRFGAFFGQTGSKVRLIYGVQKGSKFGFGGQTWVCVSLKFDQSGLK